jgi:[phosphatase 2A protein]-leucine-carboxy methyltransferase
VYLENRAHYAIPPSSLSSLSTPCIEVMSAPSIPNLNSLRRGGPRLRGSNRGRGDSIAPSSGHTSTGHRIANPPSHAAIQDRIIRATDNDAATSRLSAVAAGYLDDPFAALLYAEAQPAKRLPLMNRGSYVRTTAIDRIVDTFLATHEGQKVQIVSLGAGSDTRYFRLHQTHRRRSLNLVYHEYDLAQNVQAKIARLRRPEFVTALNKETSLDWPSPLSSPPSRDSGTDPSFTQGFYSLQTLDLRSLPPTSDDAGSQPPQISAIEPDLPTLLISECCLCYLPPELAVSALHFFTKAWFPPSTPLSCVIYEPTRPFDAFGRTMTSNLASRGISLPTLEKYNDLNAQKERLRKAGFTEQAGATGDGIAGAEAVDLDFVWKHWIGEEEREIVEGLEWMDEVEEFELLGKHYVVAYGWRGYREGKDEKWRALPSEKS